MQDLNPKNIKNTSKSLDIYSALRDPLTGEVRLFLEYYPYHQSQLTEEERQDATHLALHTIFWGCLFSNAKNFSEPVAIHAKKVCARAQLRSLRNSPHLACAAHALTRQLCRQCWCPATLAGSSTVVSCRRIDRCCACVVPMLPGALLRAASACQAGLGACMSALRLLLSRRIDTLLAGACAQVHQMALGGNGWVDCVTAERYRYVKLQLHSGHVHYQVGILLPHTCTGAQHCLISRPPQGVAEACVIASA